MGSERPAGMERVAESNAKAAQARSRNGRRCAQMMLWLVRWQSVSGYWAARLGLFARLTLCGG